jgi:hypothetical protein
MIDVVLNECQSEPLRHDFDRDTFSGNKEGIRVTLFPTYSSVSLSSSAKPILGVSNPATIRATKLDKMLTDFSPRET